MDILIGKKRNAETSLGYTNPCHPESCAELVSVLLQGPWDSETSSKCTMSIR